MMMITILNMKKEILLKYLKLLTGSVLAIAFANALSLRFSYAAGIITLLTIQDTRKETLQITLKRVIIFVIMTGISVVVFTNTGYTLPAFAIVMVPYLFLCFALKMKEAIAPIAVLCTHYISEQSSGPDIVLNEFLILAVGAGTGIFLNIFVPDNKMTIRRRLRETEDKMREIFSSMAAGIENYAEMSQSDEFFNEVDTMLRELRKEAVTYSNNHFLRADDYYYEYVGMRMEQCRLMKQIYQDIAGLSMVPEQAKRVADYFYEISRDFHETNNAEILLEHLEKLYDYFRKDPLPLSRAEFENRALLFHIIESMRNLVTLKKMFYLKYNDNREIVTAATDNNDGEK